MNINAGSKNGGFPNIFGKGFLSVQSDSMKRNEERNMLDEWSDYEIGGFSKGDLLTVNVFKDSDCKNLKVGDVITFVVKDLNNGAGGLNTHRIVYISDDLKSVITQGDARAQLTPFIKDNPFEGENANYNYQLEASGAIENVEVENIKGVVTGVNVGAGKVLDNIQKNWLWYFVLPVLVFLLFEVFLVVRNIMDLKGAKQSAKLLSDKEAMMADLEAQKEEMRKQILAELEQAQLEKSKKEDSDSSKDVNE